MQSGSMSGIAINASISTGIILEDLCRRMELPCYIGGFTSLVGGLQYISYVEYGSVDAKDKYRLTGMSSCGGTPTGMAIRYMTARLKKLPAANKLLIVSTDGRSADGADALQKIIKEAKKDGVTVVGAGIGASRSAVEKEFGDAFLDVSDMEKMPQLLAGIVKRHLLRYKNRSKSYTASRHNTGFGCSAATGERRKKASMISCLVRPSKQTMALSCRRCGIPEISCRRCDTSKRTYRRCSNRRYTNQSIQHKGERQWQMREILSGSSRAQARS